MDQPIHGLFEAQAAAAPDATALVFEGQTLTYRGLDRRANQLARRLAEQGVGLETPVGVCMERSLEMVVSLYAILKAGGHYVPLEPSLPSQRLSAMIKTAGVELVLSGSNWRENLDGADVTILEPAITRDAEGPEGDHFHVPVSGRNLAYIIFTSGSTGEPKGVGNSHEAILNRLQWMQDAYTLDANDRVLQKTPYSFDVSVWEFFWPLMFGARLVVARPEGHRDPRYLEQLMLEQDITTLHFVPSMLNLFLEETSAALPALRRVISSGEALSTDVVLRFQQRFQAPLHNLYGPTEAAVDVTHWTCPQVTPDSRIPIGKPIANTEIHILDSQGKPAPIGIPGELHIGGINPARGYSNRPALTAERFVPDSQSNRPGARLYKTGDSARWTGEGVIEYLGRLDFQVKIRGLRIELGEIEAALEEHAKVGSAAVVVREDQPGNSMLTAYITAAATAQPGRQELQQLLRSKLPEYMVPNAYVAMDQFPLTANGKLDRKRLPQPQTTTSTQRIAPRNPVEMQLATIWADLLNRGDLGVTDHFFQLGGQSLLAVRLMGRIEERFGMRLPLTTIFTCPTIETLATRLTRYQGEITPLVPIKTTGEGNPWFLVHPVGGQVHWYLEPARNLQAPVYGLQALGLIDADAVCSEMEDMASSYLQAIRKVQPHGPYRLAGWSLGGSIAFEMARQVEAEGEDIENLILIDAPRDPEPEGNHNDPLHRVLNMVADLAAAHKEALPNLLEELSKLEPETALDHAFDRLTGLGVLPPGMNRNMAARLIRVHEANLEAVRGWQPQTYQGPIHMIRATQTVAAYAERFDADRLSSFGWQAYCTRTVTVTDIETDHYGLFDGTPLTCLTELFGKSPEAAEVTAPEHKG